MELEKIARKYVQGLKDLYVNVSIYGVVSIISLLAWLSFGGHNFWPIWVFLAFGIATVLQGWTIGSIKKLEEILPFLKPEWEEQQLKKLLRQPVSAKINSETPNHITKENHDSSQNSPVKELKETVHVSPKQEAISPLKTQSEKTSNVSSKPASLSKVNKPTVKKKVVSKKVSVAEKDEK